MGLTCQLIGLLLMDNPRNHDFNQLTNHISWTIEKRVVFLTNRKQTLSYLTLDSILTNNNGSRIPREVTCGYS